MKNNKSEKYLYLFLLCFVLSCISDTKVEKEIIPFDNLQDIENVKNYWFRNIEKNQLTHIEYEANSYNKVRVWFSEKDELSFLIVEFNFLSKGRCLVRGAEVECNHLNPPQFKDSIVFTPPYKSYFSIPRDDFETLWMHRSLEQGFKKEVVPNGKLYCVEIVRGKNYNIFVKEELNRNLTTIISSLIIRYKIESKLQN